MKARCHSPRTCIRKPITPIDSRAFVHRDRGKAKTPSCMIALAKCLIAQKRSSASEELKSDVYTSNTPGLLQSPFATLRATMRALCRAMFAVDTGRNTPATAWR
eukprot:2262307-Pyramimonas_sp.AAC.1